MSRRACSHDRAAGARASATSVRPASPMTAARTSVGLGSPAGVSRATTSRDEGDVAASSRAVASTALSSWASRPGHRQQRVDLVDLLGVVALVEAHHRGPRARDEAASQIRVEIGGRRRALRRPVASASSGSARFGLRDGEMGDVAALKRALAAAGPSDTARRRPRRRAGSASLLDLRRRASLIQLRRR